MKIGLKAKFFHPMTLGVMHWGTVKKIHSDGSVTVRFEICGRLFRTYSDNICIKK